MKKIARILMLVSFVALLISTALFVYNFYITGNYAVADQMRHYAIIFVLLGLPDVFTHADEYFS